MSRLLFLDIDGTIYAKGGNIPQSAKEAIKEAKDQGAKIFLCSGRSISECNETLLELGFDGMVLAAGAYVSMGEQIFYYNPMKQEDVVSLLQRLDEHQIGYAVETNTGIFGNEKGIEKVDLIMELNRKENPDLPADFLGHYEVVEDASKIEKVNKILFFDAPLSMEQMIALVGSRFGIVPNTIVHFGGTCGEISEAGMNKAKGITKLLEFIPETIEDTVAIGDGFNDIEMLQTAYVGIAMGNARDEVKTVANYVTRHVDEDGLAYAIRKVVKGEW